MARRYGIGRPAAAVEVRRALQSSILCKVTDEIEAPEQEGRGGTPADRPHGDTHRAGDAPEETADASGTDDPYLRHPVRAGLMRLLRSAPVPRELTATSAAAELGVSSGLCSFHLRELARHGYLEPVPGVPGRVRPWRLPARPTASDRSDQEIAAAGPAAFAALARGLEDESYQRWLERRERVPEHWRRDDLRSGVLYLSPDELDEVAAALRGVVGRYADREHRPAIRPVDAAPVAFVTRLFPLLAEHEDPGRDR